MQCRLTIQLINTINLSQDSFENRYVLKQVESRPRTLLSFSMRSHIQVVCGLLCLARGLERSSCDIISAGEVFSDLKGRK